ncbi:hypothetical protein GCM10010964_43610 [Caldovatus sediminis]|uniref:Uncharacterized protein n=1 Tax=Caldovatus sediminis TaxID=2041189 RepID=A0A8J2ZF37_9PROT|nr:hypothetical protein [Caldovatus sediminis]GGG51716.1 hypothetical protein GCM10010964_43610 [Caldovatus sediminis]
MTTTIRKRLSMVAFRAETTQGTDAISGTPAPGDWVTCQAEIRFVQDQTPNPVVTGSYDDLPPIPGGLRAEIAVTLPVTGSGAAGTAPEWGKLLLACRMVETVTAAAVGAPTAATAGTATTVTAATPFGTTAQQYRGMPILLSGNPAAGSTDVVLDYTAGRVVTLAKSYSPALDTSTLLQIPINVLYRPTSDETQEKSLTCYAYEDGLRHKILGCKGSWSVALAAGRHAMLTVRLTGMVAAMNEAVALPTNYTPLTRQPPRWAGGVAQLNRALAACATASWDMAVRTAYPENPEAGEGFDPPIITGAAPRITLDPFSHATNTPSRSGAFRAGTPMPFAAQWGSVAGNRFALSCPSAQVVDLQPQERSELGVDAIALAPDTPDATMFLACF